MPLSPFMKSGPRALVKRWSKPPKPLSTPVDVRIFSLPPLQGGSLLM
jgi:hypothetical protein